jgi:hypothetical protein
MGLLYYEMLSGLVQCSDDSNEWHTAVTKLRDEGISSLPNEFIDKHRSEVCLILRLQLP